MRRRPLVGMAGAPLSLNRYAYALNNPVTLVDPTGLDVLGSFTHQYIIEPAFILSHPTFRAEQTYVDSITGEHIRIDLLDWVQNTFYEIKPWNQLGEGIQQVANRQGYGFGPGGPVADLWINGPFLGSIVHVWWELPGLLLYEWLFEPPPIFPLPFPSPGREPSRLPKNFPNPKPIPTFLGGYQIATKSSVLR